jgi:hypothetical protein
MNERERDTFKASQIAGSYGKGDILPYQVELWDKANSDSVERILARVADLQLARAIFEKAQGEHPGRRVTLRRGMELLADSSR